MTDKIVIRDGEVDTAVIAEYESSRRDLIRRGIAVGGGLVAAGAIPTLLRVRNAFAAVSTDAVLESAIDLEQVAVFSYDTAARSGKLGKGTPVAKLFRDQEQEHADALIQAQKDLGGRIANKPERPADVQGLAEAAAGGATGILRFAEQLETMAVAAYYDAHAKLKDPKLLSTGASIMADEAQHLVVLRQALKQPPSPKAFVTGKS
jgi:ferritin-like protein